MTTPTLAATAASVGEGSLKATVLARDALERAREVGDRYNAFSCLLGTEAVASARAVDDAVSKGQGVGPLAGCTFAVKDNFDVAGVTTRAGSVIETAKPPAATDATAVGRLRAAGAVLVGTANMDEYAYGFTTENSHYGPARNPHDPARVAGGSSGGSAVAVAGGAVPFALGTDTNGSVRVPSALCGLFGLRPTYGRVPRSGVLAFTPSLDTVGIIATGAADLAAVLDVLQGADGRDPVCRARSPGLVTPELSRGIDGLRTAVATGYFARGGTRAAYAAVAAAARLAGATLEVEVPHAAAARAAALVLTAAEGAEQRMDDLRSRAADFDPMTRYRFLAGALVPASAYIQAQRFRRYFHRQMLEVFQHVDVVLAPATPFEAPLIGQRTARTDEGDKVLTQPYLGVYTQPLSLAGLPVVTVPVPGEGNLPVGVQVVAAPWRDADALRVAAHLESGGLRALVALGTPR